MKMQHVSVMRHMFYFSFVTQKPMVTFIFKFVLGQANVRSNQANQVKFSNSKCYYKICWSCPVLSQNSKSVIIYLQPSEMQKCVSKIDVNIFDLFFYRCTTKNKDRYCFDFLCVLFVCRFTTYISFSIPSTFWIWQAFCFEKLKFSVP